MAAPRYSEDEIRDLRALRRGAYLQAWGHLGRTPNSWRNKRQSLGMHANPSLDPDGEPWYVAPRDTIAVDDERFQPSGTYQTSPQGTFEGHSADIVAAPVEQSTGVSLPREPVVTAVVGVSAGERPDVESIKAKHIAQYRTVLEEAERKRFQYINITHGPVMLALVSDMHIGNPGTDIKRLYAEQDMINATPGAHVFLLGDVADSFLVGRLKDQNMTHSVTIPDEWALVEDYVNRWRNLRAFVGGNHDAWSRSSVGFDLHRRLIADGTVLYDTDDLRLTVNVGPHPVKLRLRHKLPGSSIYNKTHAQERSILFDDPTPDIVVSGHTHTGAMARELHHGGKRKIAIQLGTYKRFDTYASQEGFAQNDGSTAAAVIIMQDGSFFATGSLHAACQFMHGVYRAAAA